jgi:serine/threonine protein kinase
MSDVIGKWRLGEELGTGHFAKVKMGTHMETGRTCAIKIVKKLQGACRPLGAVLLGQPGWPRHGVRGRVPRRALSARCPTRAAAGSKMSLVQTEVDILKKVRALPAGLARARRLSGLSGVPQVSHPYIVRCYDVIEEADKIYFFMEL